jgi:hypothetical protein
MRTSWLVGAAAAAFLLTGPVYAAQTGTDNSDTGTSGSSNSGTMTRYAQATPPSAAITLPGAGQGNDARQGRYYDENDQWLDPHTGLPVPGAPQLKDGGGY